MSGWFKDTRYTSIDNFKNSLGSNNVIVYYETNSYYYTPITDSTLISQLDAIEKAKSKEGQTNISQTNNDLPFIINATALLNDLEV